MNRRRRLLLRAAGIALIVTGVLGAVFLYR